MAAEGKYFGENLIIKADYGAVKTSVISPLGNIR